MSLRVRLVNEFQFLYPVFFIVFILSVSLLFGSSVATDYKRAYPVLREVVNGLGVGSFIIVLCMLFNFPSNSESFLIRNQLQINIGIFGFWVILTLFTLVILASMRGSLAVSQIHPYERTVLIFFSWIGIITAVSSSSFLSLYLGLELQALSFYVIAGLRRSSSFSTEAALKYFLLGALTSGLFLFGITLIYRETGRLDYEHIYNLFLSKEFVSYRSLTGCFFILISLLFKIGRAPFHQWLPDVYEGSSTLITTYFSTIPKIAITFVLLRLCYGPFVFIIEWWRILFIFRAFLSLVVGTFGALSQRKIKRFFAYRSIRHNGYLLLSMAAGTLERITAVICYIVLYVIISILIWVSILGFCQQQNKQDSYVISKNRYLTDLGRFFVSNEAFSFSLIIGILSIAGIPPLSGFFAKSLVFFNSLSMKYYSLVLFAVIRAVISSYYYLRWVKVIYFDSYHSLNLLASKWFLYVPLSRRQSLTISSCTMVIIFCIVFPDPLLVWSYRVALTFFL